MSEEFLGQSESDGPQSKRKKILIGSTVGLLLLVFIGVVVFIGQEKNNSSSKVFSPKGKLVIAAQFDSVGYFQDGMVTYSTRPSDLPLFSGGLTVPCSPIRLTLKNLMAIPSLGWLNHFQ